jgi:hypothetical protein
VCVDLLIVQHVDQCAFNCGVVKMIIKHNKFGQVSIVISALWNSSKIRLGILAYKNTSFLCVHINNFVYLFLNVLFSFVRLFLIKSNV